MSEQKHTFLLYYNVSDSLEYICKAKFGAQSYDPVWQISKLSYDVNDNLISVRYANNIANFDKVVDDRATYQYTGNLETTIIATSDNPVFQVFDLTSSGATYDKEGDDGDLGATESFFLSSDHISVRHGNDVLKKGTEVFWLSQTTLKVNLPLLEGLSLIIRT